MIQHHTAGMRNVNVSESEHSEGVGADLIMTADVIMYTPYYIRESLYNEKTLDMESIIDEIYTSDRADTCLANLDWNENINGYSYKYVRKYIPFIETLVWIGQYYDSFSGLSTHDLHFSYPVVVTEDYWSYEWYDGDIVCSYIIPFYDETADLYGEAGFDENDKLIGLSFCKVADESEKVDEEVENDAENSNSSTGETTSIENDPATAGTTSTTVETPVSDSTTDTSASTSQDTSSSTTTNSSSGTSTSGGATFVIDMSCDHEYQTEYHKISDEYTSQEIGNYGYECYSCGHKTVESGELSNDLIPCPNCGFEAMEQYVDFVTVTVPAQYSKMTWCVKCGNVTGQETVTMEE